MRKLFQWLAYSSSNPSAISLTLKGFLPLLVLLGIDSADSEALADSVSQLVIALSQVVLSVVTIVGFVRKLWLTR